MRLLYRIVEDPNLWTDENAPHHLRSMVDARITAAWLLWQQDPNGFRRRIDRFLTAAKKHHIRPIFVLFDSCWDPFPELGIRCLFHERHLVPLKPTLECLNRGRVCQPPAVIPAQAGIHCLSANATDPPSRGGASAT